MITGIKNKIESKRGTRNILWSTLVFLKDTLNRSIFSLDLRKKRQYRLNRIFWRLKKKSDTKLDVTLLYLNWKRKDLLLQILKDAKQQSGEFKIVVIDNSGYDKEHPIHHSGVEIVRADNSNKCWERWIYAKKVSTKYFCVMDDDLTFIKRNTIESCHTYMESHPEVDCVGAFGVQYDPNKGYWGSLHLENPERHLQVPIVKGRFMFIRTESLKGMNMDPDLTCDDIKVSSHLNKKILLKRLADNFVDLVSKDEAGLWMQPNHRNNREVVVKKYFPQIK